MAHRDPIRRAIGPNGNEYLETWCNSFTSLCIITRKKHEPLCEHEQIKPLRSLGIKVETLRNPAIPSYVRDTTVLNTPEWELAFTPSMRYKIQFEPVNAAISISHLRAIAQCLAGSTQRWCIIIEEDAKPTMYFAIGIISALLAVSGAPSEDDSVYHDPPGLIYFCMSEHAPRQQTRALKARAIWTASHSWAPAQPCLKNLTPYLGIRSDWIGQGGRGYIINPEFAQFVLSRPIGNPWDLHLLDCLEAWYGRAYSIYPSPLLNEIDPAQAARGSERLASYFGNNEAITDYILLLFTKKWGLWNRVRSIIWAAILASTHRMGLFVLWEVSQTCDLKFEEVFPFFASMVTGICGGARYHLPFLMFSMAHVYI